MAQKPLYGSIPQSFICESKGSSAVLAIFPKVLHPFFAALNADNSGGNLKQRWKGLINSWALVNDKTHRTSIQQLQSAVSPQREQTSKS